MKNSSKSSMPQNGDTASSVLVAIAWVCAMAAFIPLIIRLVEGVAQSGQLADAFIILVCSCVILALEYGIKPHKPIFSREAAVWLFAGYISIFCSRFFGAWGAVVILAGFSASIVAAGISFFGPLHDAVSRKNSAGKENSVAKNWIYATGIAFFCFTILSFLVSAFDFPLRAWAGLLSASILKFFNDTTTLLVSGGLSPHLAIRIDSTSYLVATECNGFGIISSSVVLSVIVAAFRKNISLFRRLFIVVVSVAAAYLANSLRIVAIILLAPRVGSENYNIMHECVGYFFFAIILTLVWLFAQKFGTGKNRNTER